MGLTIYENLHAFLYSGRTEVLRQTFAIKSKPYHIYTYSNPPVTFLTTHFFDHLLEKQIQTANKLKDIGKVEDTRLIQYLVELNETPLLKNSIQSIVDSRQHANQDYSQMIIRDCNGHISSSAAQLLSGSINATLNSVSPLFHPAIWWLGTALAVIFSIWRVVKVPMDLKGFVISSGITFVLIIVIGRLTMLISDFIINRRARKLSSQHLVRTDNSEPILGLMKFGVIYYVIGSILKLFF